MNIPQHKDINVKIIVGKPVITGTRINIKIRKGQ